MPVLLQDPGDVSFPLWSSPAVVWNSSLDRGVVLHPANVRSASCFYTAAALAGIEIVYLAV